MSRRAVAAGALVVVAVGAAATFALSRSDGAGAADAPTPTTPRETTTVARRDLVQEEEVDGRLGYGDQFPVLATGGGTVTALPVVGQVIERGQQLWEVDGAGGPVLLYGGRPMFRELAQGVDDGPDVRQLEENLVALGHADAADLTVDDEYTSATAEAVERWQESLGLEETGRVARGDVAFMLGPVRVARLEVVLGAEATGELLAVTGSTQLVHVDLATDVADLVATGDEVEVDLPDGSTITGTVASVGTVVETEQDQTGGEISSLPVTIELPGAPPGLDDAPVDVRLVRSKAEGVLAVPVRSLLALAEGGYALERVASDGSTELVAVELGEFADGFVEVRGDVAEGDEVVVA